MGRKRKEHIFIENVEHKHCSSCDRMKILDDFSKNKTIWDGLGHHCKSCVKLSKDKWVKNNTEKIKQYSDEYYRANKHEINNRCRQYKSNNSKKMKEYINVYRKTNIDKIKEYGKKHYYSNIDYYRKYYQNNREYYLKRNLEYSKKYSKAYPEKVNACNAKRRAIKLKATPNWLTNVQYEEIKLLYKLSKQLDRETNMVHHVDHIVPLINDNVCGLHVPWNLQVLSSSDNMSKSNRLMSSIELEICYDRNIQQLIHVKTLDKIPLM